MKSIWIKICAVCLILIAGVLAWEITATFIWKSQRAELVKQEHADLEREFDIPYAAYMRRAEKARKRKDGDEAFRLVDEASHIRISKPSWEELEEQAEENVRKRGNPYSLFR